MLLLLGPVSKVNCNLPNKQTNKQKTFDDILHYWQSSIPPQWLCTIGIARSTWVDFLSTIGRHIVFERTGIRLTRVDLAISNVHNQCSIATSWVTNFSYHSIEGENRYQVVMCPIPQSDGKLNEQWPSIVLLMEISTFQTADGAQCDVVSLADKGSSYLLERENEWCYSAWVVHDKRKF